MGVSGQRHASAALYPRERTAGTHCTGGWVADTEVTGKALCPCHGSNLDRPVAQPVARHYTDRVMTGAGGNGVSGALFFLRTFLTAEVFPNHSGFLDHIQLTHTVGLLWTSDQTVAEASTYTGQHNIEHKRQTTMPSAGFEPMTQAAADLRLRPRSYRALFLKSSILAGDFLPISH
jgi:hypothetical protein